MTSQNARPTQYFSEIGNTSNEVPNRINDTIINDTALGDVLETLNMSFNDVSKHKKKTPTATTRALIKSKYPIPDPDKGFSQADKTIVNAIISTFNFLYCVFIEQFFV